MEEKKTDVKIEISLPHNAGRNSVETAKKQMKEWIEKAEELEKEHSFIISKEIRKIGTKEKIVSGCKFNNTIIPCAAENRFYIIKTSKVILSPIKVYNHLVIPPFVKIRTVYHGG